MSSSTGERFEDLPALRELRDRLERHFVSVAQPSADRHPRVLNGIRRRTRPLLVLALVLAAGGSAAAAVSLLGKASAPLSATVPAAAEPVKQDARIGVFSEDGKRYRVIVAPEINGGVAGWSTTIAFAANSRLDGGSAGSYPTRGMPFFGGSGVNLVPVLPSQLRGKQVDFVLTGPDVAAVQIGATKIATRTSPALPSGDRIAVFFVSAAAPPLVVPGPGARPPYYLPVPDPGARRSARRIPATAILPLNSNGAVIAVTQPIPTGLAGTTRFWQAATPKNPGPAALTRPPAGVCELGTHGLPGLTAKWGHVVTAVKPVSDAEGELLVSCIDAEYSLDGWPLEAAILLNAQHPGHTPGPIPDAAPVPGHPGTVTTTYGTYPNNITARRIGNAWLAVQGGRNLQQRLQALKKLEITRLDVAGARATHR